MSIKAPPLLQNLNVPNDLRDYLQGVDRFLNDVYAQLKSVTMQDIAITTSAAAPSGGQDGDIHVRVNGASTAIYININGSWSAYTNP